MDTLSSAPPLGIMGGRLPIGRAVPLLHCELMELPEPIKQRLIPSFVPLYELADVLDGFLGRIEGLDLLHLLVDESHDARKGQS